MAVKEFTNEDVYAATLRRLDIIFKNFEKIYISFSGGKDSSVLLHLALQKAREHNRLPLDVLFIDLEGQYKHTIDHIHEMMSLPGVRPMWVCLPLNLRNAVSQIRPYWTCWDKDKKKLWIRDMPKEDCVIADEKYFPFFRKGMEFEEFIDDFAQWFAGGKKTACLVGIRSDESLNRFRTIKNEKKETFKNYKWSTRLFESVYNFYPLYDWTATDVWAANGKYKFSYNRIYDLMYFAGVPLRYMRICQPYGDDQRRGLCLFKILEPETWARIVARVEGANFGNRYAQDRALGNNKTILPEGHTYKSYAKFLLNTMPPPLALHYRRKIFKFLNWWRKNGPKAGFTHIPDFSNSKLESTKKAPSWRRICKVLLRNDYWCLGLSFSPTTREHEKQLEIALKYLEHRPTPTEF